MNVDFFLRGILFYIYKEENVSRLGENIIDYYVEDICLIFEEKDVFRNFY